MSEIEFRDPPPIKTGSPGTWVIRLSPLLDHVGRWAVVHVAPDNGAAQTTASHLRAGRLVSPAGRWEFRAAGPEIFARYLGPEEEPAPLKVAR